MDSHAISALNRLEVVETGRRRRWSEEEKARIVLESSPSRVWLRRRRGDMACRVLCW
jgi:transposase